METCIDYIDYGKAVVSTDEQKWHRHLRRLKEQYPDQVRIKNEPETNDGNMVAEIPVKWVKIKPPKALNLSDEQIAARVEKMRNSKKSFGNTEERDQTEGDDEDE